MFIHRQKCTEITAVKIHPSLSCIFSGTDHEVSSKLRATITFYLLDRYVDLVGGEQSTLECVRVFLSFESALHSWLINRSNNGSEWEIKSLMQLMQLTRLLIKLYYQGIEDE